MEKKVTKQVEANLNSQNKKKNLNKNRNIKIAKYS